MQLPDILTFLVGLLGFGLVVVGLWLINPAVSLILGGAALVLWSWFVSRAKATAPNTEEG